MTKRHHPYQPKAMWMIVVAILSSAIVTCSGGQEKQPFDGQSALAFAKAQMDFGPRIPGTEAHSETGDWIAQQLDGFGWEVEARFENAQEGLVRNIFARYETVEGDPILLGAHYDTRPLADQDRLYPDRPVPGANDGASGVAVLLELARVLPTTPLRRPIWLAFFDAEDGGGIDGGEWVVGSRLFAEKIAVSPAAVVIVDMVGDDDLQLYYERNSTPWLREGIWSTAASLGYEDFIPVENHRMLDDHTPFLQRGFPAVDIIDFDYPFWHTTQDTMDKISAASLEQVGRTLQTWLIGFSPP